MGKKLVLADDEQFITIAYNDGLTRAGYAVTVAHNGLEAVEAVKREMPDLVLLDLIMPKMTGFEALTTLKQDPATAKIPIMILSNLSQATDEAEARRLGATAFLVKSDLSLEDLIANIKKIIGE